MRKGRRLAVDVGSVRVGVAICDPDGILATPLAAIKRKDNDSETLASIGDLLREHNIFEVIVGDPMSLSGAETKSTSDARSFAMEIARLSDVPVRLVDERLTTVSATQKLREAGMDSRTSREFIDSASAVEILEQALNIEKSTNNPPGRLLDRSDG